MAQNESTHSQKPDLSMIECMGDVLGLVGTLRFLWNQILCRLNKCPLNENINQGLQCIYCIIYCKCNIKLPASGNEATMTSKTKTVKVKIATEV